jgi:hypothetical protein
MERDELERQELMRHFRGDGDDNQMQDELEDLDTSNQMGRGGRLQMR